MKTKNSLAPSQSHFVEKILKKFGFENCAPLKMPYDSRIHLIKKKKKKKVFLDNNILGSLVVLYLMNCTRPDIAYATHE